MKEIITHTHQCNKKMEAWLLKSQNTPHNKIADITCISTNTLRSCFKQYQNDGIDALKIIKFLQPSNALTSYESTIREHFTKNPCSNIKQACHEIAQLTGIQRKSSHVREYLRSIGMQPRRTSTIYAKYDHDKQAIFHDEELMPRL